MQSGSAPLDLIVIGAGINGAAIAREAALSGLRVLLVERGDLGAGTTGASSRLIHGGLRYLEHLELGLVRESLVERERLLRAAPHLVAPLELCIPLYEGARRKPWQIGLGLTLYDWLASGSTLPNHSRLTRDALLGRIPSLNPSGLLAGVSYFDAQARFPERLVVENVRDAVEHGARLLTHTRVTRIRIADERVVGVDWRSEAGVGGAADAPIVVNAAGPWVDEVLEPIRHRRLIGGTKGSHLVIAHFTGAPDRGLYVEAGSDGRPFFILPWNGMLLVGTTDERFEGDPAGAAIDAEELAYLIAETERALPASRPLAPRVLYTQTGVRPLPYRPRGAAGAITRRHLIRSHTRVAGLYSVVGGKLTTHRSLAEAVLKALRRRLPRLRESPTRERRLPGALDSTERDALLADLSAQLGAAQASRLWSIYGAAARHVAALALRKDLAGTLTATGPLTAELVYALDEEWAVTLGDILLRRCMTGLEADFGLAAAAAASERLAQLGLWSRDRAAAELAAYRDTAASHRSAAARAAS